LRRVRYAGAMSLDGHIFGPNGEADWIVIDPEINFGEFWAQFDPLLMGRRTYETAIARLGRGVIHGMKTVVVSRTLRPSDHPEIAIISELNQDQMQVLRAQRGKDKWLFGGGELFRFLLPMREVNTVGVSVLPVLLGGGVKLLPSPAQQAKLRLSEHKVCRSGIVSLVYEVQK